jgi:hypothetical protein
VPAQAAQHGDVRRTSCTGITGCGDCPTCTAFCRTSVASNSPGARQLLASSHTRLPLRLRRLAGGSTCSFRQHRVPHCLSLEMLLRTQTAVSNTRGGMFTCGSIRPYSESDCQKGQEGIACLQCCCQGANSPQGEEAVGVHQTGLDACARTAAVAQHRLQHAQQRFAVFDTRRLSHELHCLFAVHVYGVDVLPLTFAVSTSWAALRSSRTANCMDHQVHL